MRKAKAGEVWEWCVSSDGPENERWEPVLLLSRLGLAKYPPAGHEDVELHDWKALDLLTGEVCRVANVPCFGWEKLE